MLIQDQNNSSGLWPDNIQHSFVIYAQACSSHGHFGSCQYKPSDCGCVRLEIEAQEQALEQLEKSTQEATRKAHDAEQRARSAQETFKANPSFLCIMFVCTLVCSCTCMAS